MPDANYAVNVSSWQSASTDRVGFNILSFTTTSFSVNYVENATATNPNVAYITVVR